MASVRLKGKKGVKAVLETYWRCGDFIFEPNFFACYSQHSLTPVGNFRDAH